VVSHIVPPYVGDAVLRTEVRPTPAVEVGIYVPPINCPTCRAVRTAAICADAAAQGRDDGPTGGGGAGDPAADQTASGLSRMLAWPTVLLENIPSFPPRERRFHRLRPALHPPGRQRRDPVEIGRMRVTDHVRGNVAAGITAVVE
jgi:hypothetical protein